MYIHLQTLVMYMHIYVHIPIYTGVYIAVCTDFLRQCTPGLHLRGDNPGSVKKVPHINIYIYIYTHPLFDASHLP